MRRFVITCINGGLLTLILIGVPSITGAQWGSLEVSSTPEARTLTLWGLSLAAAANAAAALLLVKERKARILCWEWAIAFGGLIGIEFAVIHRYLNFDWLKQTLSWVQKHF